MITFELNKKRTDKFFIYFEDTDCQGVVYHSKYLNFLERARTNFLFEQGFTQSELLKKNIFFVVKNINIDFLSSAKLEDTVTVESTIVQLKKCFLTFFQEIFVNESKVVSATIKVVSVTKDQEKFKPVSFSNY